MTTIPVDSVGAFSGERATVAWGRVSWGPIMMGAVTAIGLQFIFTILGIAIGVSAADASDAANATAEGVKAVSMAAGAWWLITGTIALAAGGYVFGRLGGMPRSVPLMLEATTLWAVVAIFGFLVIWSGAGMAGATTSPMAAMTARTGGTFDMSSGGSGAASSADGQRANLASSGRPNQISPAMAEEARRAARTASWWSVMGLIIGIAASIGGSWMGAPDPRRRIVT